MLTAEKTVLGKMDYIPSSEEYHFEVIFDFDTMTHYVQERHESENARSFYEAHGHACSYYLPMNADASLFEDWLSENAQPIIVSINSGYTSEWNGYSHMARFTNEAQEAKSKLDTLFGVYSGQEWFPGECESSVPTLDSGEGHWEVGDWLGNTATETLEEYSITAESTDEELIAATNKIEAEALTHNVVVSGTRQWLEYQKSNLE